jgi:hypothetical protein
MDRTLTHEEVVRDPSPLARLRMTFLQADVIPRETRDP